MNKIATLTLFFIALTFGRLNAQSKGVEGEWKLPFLPVALTYSTEEGFGIKGTASILTPIGQFSISSPSYNISSSSSEQNNNKKINERVIVEKPVYKDRIVYKGVKYVDKVVKVPVIKEVVKEVILKEKEYLLVIRNRQSNNDMLFIIKGVDEIEAEIEGRTSISAKEGQIIIDITDAKFSQIKFRGEQWTQIQQQKDKEERERTLEKSEPYKPKVKERVRCGYCNGDGYVECDRCKAKGIILCASCRGKGCGYCGRDGVLRTCPDCNGQKRFPCRYRHR